MLTSAAECEEDVVAQHMVGEALLAANLVAAAEKAGMRPAQINAILKDVIEKSAIDEFWITDPSGHAYLTNTGVDFTFSPDPANSRKPPPSGRCSTAGRRSSSSRPASARSTIRCSSMSASPGWTSRASCRSASPRSTSRQMPLELPIGAGLGVPVSAA